MNKPLTILSDIFVRRIETRRKGMRTDRLGWWVLEENKNRGRVLWKKGRQIKMWYSNTGSFPGVIRRALLSQVGDTLIVREVDQGQAKSLPNAEFTGCKSANGRVNSTSLRFPPLATWVWYPGTRRQARECERTMKSEVIDVNCHPISPSY